MSNVTKKINKLESNIFTLQEENKMSLKDKIENLKNKKSQYSHKMKTLESMVQELKTGPDYTMDQEIQK